MRSDLRFCVKHHWQHLSYAGTCAWCETIARLKALDAEPQV